MPSDPSLPRKSAIEARIHRDLGRLSVDLPLRPSWIGRLAVAALLAVGALAIASGGAGLSILFARGQPSELVADADCGWVRPNGHESCQAHETMHSVQLERTVLKRRAFHLTALEPRIEAPVRPGRPHFRMDSHAEAHWLTQPEAERQHLIEILREGAGYRRTEETFFPSALGRPGYLGRLVEDYSFELDDGTIETVGPSHPLALEADRLTVADIQRATPLVEGLAGAARIDSTVRKLRISSGSSVFESPVLWLVVLGLGALAFLIASMAMLLIVLRREHHHVSLDATGVRIGDRRIRWEKIASTDLDAWQPSVRLTDGTQVRTPPVRVPDGIGAELQAEAAQWISQRRDDPDAAREARELLDGALKDRRKRPEPRQVPTDTTSSEASGGEHTIRAPEAPTSRRVAPKKEVLP